MTFFDDLGKKLTQAGQDVAQQTKIFAETTRLNSCISDEEKQIESLYRQIGKQYFEENKDNASASYRDLILNIRDAQDRIAQYGEQVRQVRGVKLCPSCGAEVAIQSAFCNVCGVNIPVPVSENPVAPVAPVVPTVPAAPVVPVVPTAPTAPTAPVVPSAPTVPQLSKTPATAAVGAKCPKCGTPISNGGKFCTFCGCSVNDIPSPIPMNTMPTQLNSEPSQGGNTPVL